MASSTPPGTSSAPPAEPAAGPATEPVAELAAQLAQLARVALSEAERETIGGQLERILAYLDQLREVDVEGVPEYLGAAPADSALRVDAVGPMLTAQQALAGAPQTRGQLFAVPKFKD